MGSRPEDEASEWGEHRGLERSASAEGSALRIARRELLSGGLTVSLAMLLLPRVAAAAGPKLLVFVPSTATPRAVQTELGSALGGVEVTVFGRFNDFAGALPTAAAAIAPLQALRSRGLTLRLQGVAAGQPTEPYVLLGLDRAPPTTIATVGMVDLLGRQGTQALARELLASSTTQVKPVTKYDDLLPLLQFKGAEAVLLPARLVGYLRAKTQLNLVMTALSGRVSLSALAVISAAGEGIATRVRGLSASLNTKLGVEKWQ